MRRKREARMWRQVQHEMQKAARRVEQVSHTLASDGLVRPGVSRTGTVVLRCTVCGKVCYSDRKSAEQAIAKIPDPMEAYVGPDCGFWHLATIRSRTVLATPPRADSGTCPTLSIGSRAMADRSKDQPFPGTPPQRPGQGGDVSTQDEPAPPPPGQGVGSGNAGGSGGGTGGGGGGGD